MSANAPASGLYKTSRGFSQDRRIGGAEMNHDLWVLHGSSEYPCITEDDGTCSLACPNRTRKDGFRPSEAAILHLRPQKLHCAIGKEVHEGES